MKQPLKILLTNDDGFHAAGLQKLYETIKDIAQVTIVAPDRERSAVGHGITMHFPLRVEPILIDEQTHWTTDGTPSDCVKLALETDRILKNNLPDLVISGINRGPNLGNDILYSGTVSAAIEGAMHNIPSIAVSLDNYGRANFAAAAKFIREHLMDLKKLAENSILNINFPANDLTHSKVNFTKLGKMIYRNVFEERKDPRNRVYYWIGGEYVHFEQEENSDIRVVEQGHISITPLTIDLTNYAFLQNKPQNKYFKDND